MDALDRMIVQLVRVIRASHPQYLTGPFEVGELHQTILPYRHYRRELQIETNQEYEFTLTQLLSGARGYLAVDDRMRDALEHEVASPNPDTEKFRRFAELRVALSPAALERELVAGGAPTSDAGASVETPQAVASTVRLSTPGAAPAVDEGTCRYCKGKLPVGRRVVFCPYCGQNVTISNCAACGAEMEVGWKYCVACGRSTGQDG